MTVTYEVGGSTNGDLAIDFWVSGPDGTQIHKTTAQPQGSYSFTTPHNAPRDGRYTYCFSNSGTGTRTLRWDSVGL